MSRLWNKQANSTVNEYDRNQTEVKEVEEKLVARKK